MTGVRRLLAATGVPLGVALVVAACSSPATPKVVPTTTSTPSSTTTTRPAAPAGSAVQSGFQPGSASFVSSTTGFVIGIDPTCAAGSCVALARTTDGGSSWVALSAPDAGYVAGGNQPGSPGAPVVSEVRFADELDGWIYGPALFATHDGGATWKQVSVSGSVVSLETSGGFVDAVVSPCTVNEGNGCTGPMQIQQAPAAGGPFTTVLSGPSVSSYATDTQDLSLHAPVGFANLSGVNAPSPTAIYATSDLAGQNGWKAFPDPCAAVSGSFFASFVALDTTNLSTLCSGSGAAGSELKAVVRTTAGKSTVIGTPPSGGDTEGLAVSPSGTMVVSAASGASEMYRSTDGGAAWSTAETYSDGGEGFSDLGFISSTQAIAVHGHPGPPGDISSQLLMSRDGGATWQAVPIN